MTFLDIFGDFSFMESFVFEHVLFRVYIHFLTLYSLVQCTSVGLEVKI